MSVEVITALVVFALMIGDIVSGVLAAIVNNNLSSSVFRQGLGKKLGSSIVVLLALGLSSTGTYIGIDTAVCDVLVFTICAMLSVMEIMSILENACKLNPDLPMSRIRAAFGLDEPDAEE